MWNPELDESQTGIKDAGRNINNLIYAGASLVAQTVENVPVMWKTWVWSLVWEDPLEKGKAIHASILAWNITWTTVHGAANSWTRLSDFHFHFSSAYHCWMNEWIPKSMEKM